MEEFLAALHPPSWTIWQTIGTGATLTLGHILGKIVINALIKLGGDVARQAAKK